MSSLSNLYSSRAFDLAQAAQHPHSDIRRQAQNRLDICDLHIRKYLQVTFRHCMSYALRVALLECQRRACVAEGLSIGIERLALRSMVTDRMDHGAQPWERQWARRYLTVWGLEEVRE